MDLIEKSLASHTLCRFDFIRIFIYIFCWVSSPQGKVKPHEIKKLTNISGVCIFKVVHCSKLKK
uniref:Uncharacterized protein n=1 Tax=Anguilla anguilla TaxID=7936 RepID=A0A0E9X8H5_ANGAN